MEISTVPVHYVNALLASAGQKGMERKAIVSATSLGEAVLSEAKARVPASAFSELTNHLTLALNDENCGLMQTPTQPGTFAMMCRACISCSTLGEFLRRCAEFNSMVTDCVDIALESNDEFAVYSITPRDGQVDEEQFIIQVLLAITHRLASWVIGQALVLESVGIARPRPYYANEYNFLFMAPIAFDQARNCLLFSAEFLNMPNVQTPQSLEEFLTVPSNQLMSSIDSDQSLVARVRSLIKGDVAGQFPEFDSVAESFHLTTATLRRRLRTEGSSYQQIKDDVRRDTAIYHLSRGTMSMEEIAQSVGFSEPTSFFRAFKRWTGVTPRSYVQSD